MNPFEVARRTARDVRRVLATKGIDLEAGADRLIEAAIKKWDVAVRKVPPKSPLLAGADATINVRRRWIIVRNDIDDAMRCFLVAHEFGHLFLHFGSTSMYRVKVESLLVDPEGNAAQRVVEGYGPRERQELQANVFARELLLPRGAVRRFFLDERCGPRAIETRLGIPIEVARLQLFDALLLPEPEESRVAPVPATPTEDQRPAVETTSRFALVQAGPGTGKTTCLLLRLRHILAGGARPEGVIVLTFSNKAAGELVDRLKRSGIENAERVWVGTFHSFGLELLRKFGNLRGLPSNIRITDTVGAMAMLEPMVPNLPLHAYDPLSEPIDWLPDLLKAIKRCKDELIGPEGYLAAIKRWPDKDQDAQRKRLDAATVFQAYEQELGARHLVDFNDLLGRSVDLLGEQNTDIDAYLKGVSHVLVDEYQDVNRASARLVQGLSTYAEVWAVGDGHQAVYGFQGASARNVTDFDKDFPGAKHFALGDNHRSSQEIVDLYYAASTHSPSGVSAPHLHAVKGPIGIKPQCVTHAKGAGLDTLAGLITSAARHGATSTTVLVPTNDEAATLARGLEQRGVPVLYLGNIFERPDIKEVLCLLHLSVDERGASLAADWLSPEYNIPTADLAKLAALAVDDQGIVSWWDRDRATLSSAGKAALSRLDDLLRPVRALVSPWDALCEILLEDGASLRGLCIRDDQGAVNARLAMYQFVNACRIPDTLAPYPTVRNLFDRIRRRIHLREHTGLRLLPPDAEGLNAVRLLTLHDCKGLEFDAVVLASARGKDTDKSDWPLIPPELLKEATGLNDSEMRATQDHNLLYVGLSRARRHLWVMRPDGQPLPAALDTLEESSESLPPPGSIQTTDRVQEFDGVSEATIDELIQYRECPRRVVLNRRIGRPPSGAFSIPRRLSLAARRIEIDLREHPELRNAAEIQGLVERELRTLELWEHPARDQFAKRIGSFAANAAQGMSGGAIVRSKVPLQLGPIRIVVEADRAVDDGASSYRIVRQRAARMEELRQPLGVLTRTHADATGEKVTFHLHVLEDNSTPKPKKVQEPTIPKYLANAESMHAGKFPAAPSSRRCPRCRYFFQCHQGA